MEVDEIYGYVLEGFWDVEGCVEVGDLVFCLVEVVVEVCGEVDYCEYYL